MMQIEPVHDDVFKSPDSATPAEFSFYGYEDPLQTSPNSYNASFKRPLDSTSSDNSLSSQSTKKKKGVGTAGRSIEEELCLICGDRASGYHYNALSCEGCKGFFRRSVTRNASYNCKYGGDCEMDMWMRRKCQACRLRRCREVGMKEECLLSEEQCKARDARRKSKTPSTSTSSVRTSQDSPDSNISDTNPPPLKRQNSKETSQTVIVKHEPQTFENPLDLVPDEDRALLEKIVLSQDQYELPDEEDIKKTAQFSAHIKDPMDAIFIQMAEMTILTTQLIVEFAKHLPGFLSLDKEDQIVVLKGSACEVMMLRTARRYDIETDTVVFGDGKPYTRNNLRFAGLQDYTDLMYDFCRGMALLKVDNAEYALITSLSIFAERPGLTNKKKVEEVQEMYLNALQRYSKARHPKGTNFFAKLLMKLTELRTLSSEYSEVLLAMKVKKGSLPPLLLEYFDVHD